MSGSVAPIVYWDSGIFIAWLMNEKRSDPAEMKESKNKPCC